MADYNSVQETKRQATPPKMLKPTENGGENVVYFNYTVPVGNIATTKTLALGMLPKGARFLGGSFKNEAMSSGGADAGVQIGDGTTAAKYLGTTSVDAAATNDFGNTIALGYGEEVTADTVITATVMTEAWLAGKKIAGHFRYLA